MRVLTQASGIQTLALDHMEHAVDRDGAGVALAGDDDGYEGLQAATHGSGAARAWVRRATRHATIIKFTIAAGTHRVCNAHLPTSWTAQTILNDEVHYIKSCMEDVVTHGTLPTCTWVGGDSCQDTSRTQMCAQERPREKTGHHPLPARRGGRTRQHQGRQWRDVAQQDQATYQEAYRVLRSVSVLSSAQRTSRARVSGQGARRATTGRSLAAGAPRRRTVIAITPASDAPHDGLETFVSEREEARREVGFAGAPRTATRSSASSRTR